MKERFPNFRRAQRERGPYYKGPPITPLRFFTLAFCAALLVAVVLGWSLGWSVRS